MEMNCRFCSSKIKEPVVDLGLSPLANSYLDANQKDKKEFFYPLKLYFCENCFLVQLADAEKPENIFSDYAYFSSYSTTWLNHARDFATQVMERFSLDTKSHVVEIASNDGYLLQFFKEREIPILGIEPALNIAKIANDKGISTICDFFNEKTADKISKDDKTADILIAINVLPHVPNLHSFVSGMKKLLKPDGVIIVQFSAYLLPFIQKTMFDSVYHEHYSYFSLITLQKIFSYHRLEIFDVEENLIHGGSLRLFIKHTDYSKITISDNVDKLIKKEISAGLTKLSTYKEFSKKILEKKINIWNFFIQSLREHKKIVCYGAPAKGNTLLNYCGITPDMIEYTVDISPHKQGKFLPGTHIPIKNPLEIKKTKPDYLVILAWNLQEEIISQMNFIRQWNAKFVVLIPEVQIF
jgi:SAM-dependent methyltransferase